MFVQDLLDLGVGGHVLVHTAINARGLTHAQIGLLVKSNALAEALVSHPGRTGGT